MLRFAKSVAAVGLIIAPLASHALDESGFLQTAELKCISDGMEMATGGGSQVGLTPSAKYLALVGLGMQRFQKDTNGTAGTDREVYQQKIIEFIQANGYCLSQIVDANGQAIPGSKGYGAQGMKAGAPEHVALMVLGTGTKSVNGSLSQNSFSTKDFDKLVEFLGFKNMDDIKAIFKNDNYSGSTPDQRQKFFNAAIKGGSYSDELKECFRQMKDMQVKSPIFDHKGTRSPDSIKLCEVLRNSCGLPEYSDGKNFCQVSRQYHTKPGGSAPKNTAPVKSGPSIYDGMGSGGGAL